MIRLANLNKKYRTSAGVRVVLDNVSAVFPSGKSVGILGLNGAGKSTLIRIIGDAEPADSGKVYSDGRVSWPLGYTGGFQGSLTARENARFVARIYGENTRYIEDFTYEDATPPYIRPIVLSDLTPGPGPSLSFSFLTDLGSSGYVLQATSDLTAPASWADLLTGIPTGGATSTVSSVEVPGGDLTSTQRHYRVVYP